MKYRQLGRTGLLVSELCFGTMTFGSDYFNVATVGEAQAVRMVGRALDAGINVFDTADVYSRGEAERLLGLAIQRSDTPREQVILATKVADAMSDDAAAGRGDVNNVGLSRAHVIDACHRSLRRLGVDYIDLYQLHGWDPLTPIEETLVALADLVRQGKVRYVGVSNWTARHVAKALTLSEERGWPRFVALQAYYSLGCRDVEHELVALCREEEVALMPWSPLAGGYLTGKFGHDGQGPKDARRSTANFPPIDKNQADRVVDVMREIAGERGCTVAQVALQWLARQPAVTSIVIGARTVDQLDENIESADVELSDEDIDRLSKLTEPPELYPRWMVRLQSSQRRINEE